MARYSQALVVQARTLLNGCMESMGIRTERNVELNCRCT